MSPTPTAALPTTALAGLLQSMADDEFVIGFSDSEWTGIAPLLEEDVAMSSLAQDELGHAAFLADKIVVFSAAPATVTAPFIPASSWPGIEQMNVKPPSGIVTVPAAEAPGPAATFSPSPASTTLTCRSSISSGASKLTVEGSPTSPVTWTMRSVPPAIGCHGGPSASARSA